MCVCVSVCLSLDVWIYHIYRYIDIYIDIWIYDQNNIWKLLQKYNAFPYIDISLCHTNSTDFPDSHSLSLSLSLFRSLSPSIKMMFEIYCKNVTPFIIYIYIYIYIYIMLRYKHGFPWLTLSLSLSISIHTYVCVCLCLSVSRCMNISHIYIYRYIYRYINIWSK